MSNDPETPNLSLELAGQRGSLEQLLESYRFEPVRAAVAKPLENNVEEQLRAIDGVVSVHNPDDRPHLTVVEYNPGKLKSRQLLETVRANGFSAQMIGI